MDTHAAMTWCCSLLLAGLVTTSSWAVLTPVDDVPVRTPTNYDPTVSSPLVIALHGYTGNGNAANGLLGLWPEAEARGFLYASPTGSTDAWGNNYWNATDACCDFFGENIDHVGYLMDLVASIQSRYNVDSSHIHFIGHSNGGFMCHALACARPDVIASVTSIAGAAWNDLAQCAAQQPVHVLQVHGTSDDTVLYSGGSFGSQYPGAQETVDRWAQQNGCQSMGTQVVDTIDFDGYVGGTETDVYRSSGCDSPGSVELWKCNGSGHGFNVTASGKDAVFSYMLEHSKSIVAACPADISGDQVVDIRDLLLLLQEWGSGDGTPSDIDASGMVDVDDLSILLAAWGECPSL
jgi:polyhydroxybutyrate depolymerase